MRYHLEILFLFSIFTVSSFLLSAQREDGKFPLRYYRALGIVNYYEKNFLAAAHALQQALLINPLDKESSELLKLVYDSLGNRQLSQKIRVRSQSIQLLFGKHKESQMAGIRNDMRAIANDYYDRGIYDSAIAAYKLSLLTNKDDTASLFYLANAYFFLKNFNDAAQNYEKLLALDKRRADVYNLAGLCYKNMDNMLKARDYFKQCLVINPNYSVAYFNLGYAHYVLEDYKSAEVNLEKASQLLPYDKDVLTILGKLYIETGQKEKALNTYERLYGLNKNNEKANVMLGQLYYEAREYEKSVFHFTQTLATVKQNVELKSMLGAAYLELKKYDAAFEWLKESANVLVDKKETQTMTARAANFLKHYQEASEYAQRALAIDKDYRPALFELAVSFRGMKKNRAAKEIMKRIKSL